MVFVVQATTPTQESVPLDLVLLTGTSSHTQQRRLACPASRVPPLLQGLVVHIADFVPNLAETSVRNVLWGEEARREKNREERVEDLRPVGGRFRISS